MQQDYATLRAKTATFGRVRALPRLLTFRLDREGYDALGARDACIGLVLAAVAGIGRHWDHPTAGALQKSGLGSVAYVLVLAAVIWLLLRPFPAHRREYANVAAAVGFTAPLAWLYALPVERWVEVGTAVDLNLAFLAVVAAWRVALYGRYLAVAARCRPLATWTLLLLPLCGIVVALSLLNLEHAVFEVMAGLDRPRDPSQRIADANYGAVLFASVLAPFLFVPLAVVYVVLIAAARRKRR